MVACSAQMVAYMSEMIELDLGDSAKIVTSSSLLEKSFKIRIPNEE